MKRKHNIDPFYIKDLIDHGFSINKIATIHKCDWSTVKRILNENPELL